MKRAIASLFYAVILAAAALSCQKNDSPQDENLMAHVDLLSEQQHSNLATLKVLEKAQSENDFVSRTESSESDGMVSSYTLHLNANGDVTIYLSPYIKGAEYIEFGIGQYGDGLWYWTYDGGWVKDGSGNRIRYVFRGVDFDKSHVYISVSDGRLIEFQLKDAASEPDPEPEPEPDPSPDTPSGANVSYSWFELPAMKDDDHDGCLDVAGETLYYAYHICAGPEKDAHGRKARNYTVCYSGRHHCPMWVAAPRHSMYVGSAGRSSYSTDPSIPSDVQYYSKSTGGGCNKGHMLGSAERTSSKATNQQVFYYTNIAPQLSSGFNTGGGGWNLLEDYVDGLVVSDTLYEVVGCYFEKYTDAYGNTVSPKTISFGDRDDVAFPTMFYYVLLRTKSGSSGKRVSDCTADELQCVAFVRSHTNDLKGQRPSSKEMMSVSELEKITGFTYFTNVPNAPKDSFKASDWGL